MLLGIPSFFIGLFGAFGVMSGEKIVSGGLGALWAYLAVLGAYELNRRRFNWERGSEHSDRNLLAGTIAVATGLVLSGALHETMPALAIVSALSAVKQADNGHDTKHRSRIHAAILVTGIGIGVWLYFDGYIGKAWLDRFAAYP